MSSRSLASDSRATWVRWCVPSVGDLLFIALLGLLTCTNLSVRLLGDAGIGWHIRTGQIILATHAVPRVDPFSASLSGKPWFAWEWLYDVKVGWWESGAGLNGVVAFTALIIALTFSGTFWMLLRRGTNVLVALGLVLLAVSASMIHFLARPHVVSWLFTVIWFWILESTETHGPQRILITEGTGEHGGHTGRRFLLWGLPVVMLAWVNFHGGFLVGFVLLAIYWCDALWLWLRLKEDRFEDALRKIRAGRRVRNLTLVGLVSAAATLGNPYGFQLHIHIYRYLSNGFLMDHIDEFQSPNFHYVAQKCFAGLLLLTLVALASNRRKASLSHGMVVLFAVYAGLYASRNIPVSSLLLILIIGPWLSSGLERFAERKSAGRELLREPFWRRTHLVEVGLRGHLWPIAAVGLVFWIAAHGGKLGSATLMNAHFDAKRFPMRAVDYIESRKMQGPVLSTDSWGGYLIYRLYPRMRVVVDDRHDFYGEEFLRSYLTMIHAEPGWQDFLRQHPADSLLIPKDSALTNLLLETGDWRAIYSDNVAVLFVRSSSKSE